MVECRFGCTLDSDGVVTGEEVEEEVATLENRGCGTGLAIVPGTLMGDKSSGGGR